MRTALVILLSAALTATAQAQNQSCAFQLDYVGGQGLQQVSGADTNYFANNGVRLRCRGTSITMSSDSLAHYGRRDGTVTDFIGKVKYRDSTVTMDADKGTYFRNGERWEARGHVITRNLENGSTLEGPSLDYYRSIPGVRDTVEIFSVGRPTIHFVSTDSTGQKAEPYVIIADRVRMRGQKQLWAGGNVNITRSDFFAHGDSLRLDTGAGNDGTLLGNPIVRGLGADSFNLTGHRIDFRLEAQALRYVVSKGKAHAVSADVDLVADTIGLDIQKSQLVQTLAWGDSIRPNAASASYQIKADSLAIDTPERVLKETRAYGKAWVGGKPDSLTHERDWISGDTVVAQFGARDSAGARRTGLQRLESHGAARSYYRVAAARATETPSLNYSRGDKIIVRMKTTAEGGVEHVDLQGHVDGVQLEPKKAPPDSTRADSTRADSVQGRRPATRGKPT
ncbi:MAG: hypothetical protein ABJD11_13715 [Gemmatimonadota bacterium]